MDITSQVKDILLLSKTAAKRLNNSMIFPEHILIGIIDEASNHAYKALVEMNVCIDELRDFLEAVLEDYSDSNDNTDNGQFVVSPDVADLMKRATSEAKRLHSQSTDSEHLLLAMLDRPDNHISQFLEKMNINYNNISAKLNQPLPSDGANFQEDDDDDEGFADETPSGDSKQSEYQSSSKTTAKKKNITPALDKFGKDMTRAAEDGKLDPVIGRDKEIERLAQILSRRKKNNPVLIGEPGVGKSAIVEGLALRISQRKVSRILFDKRVVALDMASVVAGTKYRGQFESRIKAILDELAENQNIILFIDEIHTIVGAGSAAGSMDAANMLKPALARGELQCIGATTLDEYRKNIEKDGALERRFQKVLVEPTTIEETTQILNNIKDRYEEHHGVIYTPDAIDACVKLTDRYISDRHFPDKAIDALDEAGARVHVSTIVVPKQIDDLEKQIHEAQANKVKAAQAQNFESAANFRDQQEQLNAQLEQANKEWEVELAKKREVVDADKVAEVVAMMTGVPVQRIAQTEGTRLLNMGNELKSKIVGQDDAIEQIARSIRRNRVGLKDPNRPIGSFMFLGPTGVGKTHLAKKLAEFLFGSADTLIRIDMSEYMEKFTVSRLIGAPPGYVGYEEGGQLTEKVRRHPYSVVLLDELEKAHSDVFNMLLQVMDEGWLTDSLGRKVDFKNTIIIMTSNIGSRELKDFGAGVGFNTAVVNKDFSQNVIQKALNQRFSPEFLNRVDNIVTFNPLDKEAIHKIIDIELSSFRKRVAELGYTLDISTEAIDFVADKGFDKQYGARPLKRAIQNYIEDTLAEILLKNEAVTGDTVVIDYVTGDDKLTASVKKLQHTECDTNTPK